MPAQGMSNHLLREHSTFMYIVTAEATHISFATSRHRWGSQFFLSVSALTGMVCPPRWACLWSCLPPCLPSGLGCSVRLPGLVCGLVSGLVCHLGWDAVSASLAVSGLVSQLVSHLVWDAVFDFLARLPAQLRSFAPSCFPAGLMCPCSGLVSKISCAICATVWGLRWRNL